MSFAVSIAAWAPAIAAPALFELRVEHRELALRGERLGAGLGQLRRRAVLPGSRAARAASVEEDPVLKQCLLAGAVTLVLRTSPPCVEATDRVRGLDVRQLHFALRAQGLPIAP